MQQLADVSVVIPSIPPRSHMLRRAVTSVHMQTVLPNAIHIAVDEERKGAAATRNRALGDTVTEWVAFLDDDDEFLPQHLERCMQHAVDTGADLVYPWFEVVGGYDTLGWEGRSFDPVALRQANYIPITVLVRRELMMDIGGFVEDKNFIVSNFATGEDWAAWVRLLDSGATFSHLPSRTWRWHMHGLNTQGCHDRW